MVKSACPSCENGDFKILADLRSYQPNFVSDLVRNNTERSVLTVDKLLSTLLTEQG